MSRILSKRWIWLRSRISRSVTQMHWGGGTPTYLSPGQITELWNAIAERFRLDADGEFSIEIDPRVTTARTSENVAQPSGLIA